jgi:hypothetical protein
VPYGSVFTWRPPLVADLELVELPVAETRDEDLPDARGPEAAHRMVAAVPAVEVADDRDAGRRGRPDREGDAEDPAEVARVRAQLLVDPVLVALVEEVEVLVAERRQEAVRVAELPDAAVRRGGPSS